jgi:hypothetical protein
MFLKLGQSIRLGSFGSFHISVSSDGTLTEDELSGHKIKGAKLVFRPSIELKRNIDGLSFEID